MSATIPAATVRDHGLGEEVADALSHGLGWLVAVAVAALPVLCSTRRAPAAPPTSLPPACLPAR